MLHPTSPPKEPVNLVNLADIVRQLLSELPQEIGGLVVVVHNDQFVGVKNATLDIGSLTHLPVEFVAETPEWKLGSVQVHWDNYNE